MEPEKIKKTKIEYLCGECKIAMKSQGSGFDLMSMFVGTPYYCENKDCVHFGLLTMVGIKQEVVVEEEKK